MSLFPPDTDSLVLIGQMKPISVVIVEGSHGAKLLPKEVLGATLRCQVGMIARQLGNLFECNEVKKIKEELKLMKYALGLNVLP